MKISEATNLLEEKILNGEYGKSGTRLPSARELAENEHVSFVNMLSIIKILKQRHALFSIGNKNYVSSGISSKKSDLRMEIGESNKIAIIVPSLLNPYYSAVAEKLSTEMFSKGYFGVVYSYAYNQADFLTILENIVEDKCLGFISFTPDVKDDSIDVFKKFPLPYILIGNTLDNLDTTFITSENYNSGFTVAEHLIDCKYEEFIYIHHLRENSLNYSDNRLLGFRDGITKYGLQIPNDNILSYDPNNSVSRYNVLQRIRSLASKKRLGIFCYHDLIATDLYMQLSNFDIHIPQQVGIVGYDDLKTTISPKITTCSYNFTEIASKACSLFEKKLWDDSFKNVREKVKTILIIRSSTRLS